VFRAQEGEGDPEEGGLTTVKTRWAQHQHGKKRVTDINGGNWSVVSYFCQKIAHDMT